MFPELLFLSRPLLLYLLYLLSLDKSGSLEDESYTDRSDSETSVTCTFPLRFYKSVGNVSGLACGAFVPIGVESKCDVVTFAVFVPI